MNPLSRNSMELVSGGEMPLAVLGAAGGLAHAIGRALGSGELSLASLAVSTVAGMAVIRDIGDTDATHIMNQGIFTTINAAGAYGYLTSLAMRLNDNNTQQLTDLVY